jgi:hypothetical protein
MMDIKQIVTMCLIGLSFASYAAIYVNQTKSGDIEYTDTPTGSSQPIDIPAVNTTPGSAVTQSAAATTTTKAPTSPTTDMHNNPEAIAATAPSTYSTFEIIAPKAEETIQNQAVLSVQMSVEPKLNPDDKIQILVDGSTVGTPSSSIYQEIPNIDRGTHTLSAAIINSQKQEVKRTGTITIYVHKNSLNTSPAMKPAPPPPPRVIQ